MSDKKFDPITGEPITEDQNNSQTPNQNVNTYQPVGNASGQPNQQNSGYTPIQGQQFSGAGQQSGGQAPFQGQNPSQNLGQQQFGGQAPFSGAGQQFGGAGAGQFNGQAQFGGAGAGQPQFNGAGQQFSGTGQPQFNGAGAGQFNGQPQFNGQQFPGQAPFGGAGQAPFGGAGVGQQFPGQKKKMSPALIALIAVGAVAGLVVIGILGRFLAGGSSTKPSPDEDKPISYASFEATDEPDVASTEATEEKEEEKDTSKETASAVDPSDRTALLSSFSVSGKQYVLPVDINTLLADGWKYDDENDANELVAARSTESVKLTYSEKGDAYVFFSVINHSIDTQPVSKCMICDADFSDRFVKNTGAVIKVCNDQFELQKTTYDEVISLLGDPSNTSQDNNSKTISYKGDGDDDYKVHAYFYFDNDILTSFDLSNHLTPSDFEQPDVNTDTPDYLGNYKAPSSLGDDLLSGNVSIDGVVYNLPVPYSILKENGWEFDGKADPLPSLHSGFITLKKGEYRLEAEVLNPLPNAVTLDNTIVTKVSAFNTKYHAFEFTLAGDIKPGMTKDDLDKYLSSKGITNFTYDEKYKTYRINYNKDEKSDFPKESIRIGLDDETDVIFSIDAERLGWLVE